MNVEVETPSLDVVRNFLKEADSLDPTLSENEMLDLYRALRNSHSTANEENEQRRILEQTDANCSMLEELRNNSVLVDPKQDRIDTVDNGTLEDGNVSNSSEEDEKTLKIKEKPFTPKSWSQQKKQAKVCSASSTSVEQIQPQKQTEKVEYDDVDVFNSIATTHKPLKRISVSPKYDPPIYCNPKLTNVEYRHKARTILSYHYDVLQKFNNFQRQSIFPAPWGKAIQSSARFNGSLLKKIENAEENLESSQLEADKEDRNSDDDFEMYVSKSGRQTKRKLYIETSDDSKGEWKKKQKTSSSDDETKKNPPKKRPGLSSLSNEEVMKRSKLFSDNNNVHLTRTEKMFDQLVEDGRKKKEAEKEMEKFNHSLDRISTKEDVEEPVIDVAELVHSEEPFIRRRVVPPSLPKKPTAAGKNKPSGRGRGKRNAGNKKGAQDNSLQEIGSQKYEPLEFSPSTTKSNFKQKDICPVCYEEFFQSELVEHTPICLDTHNQTSTPTKRTSDFCMERITCENCDEVLPFDMEYAVHVKECLEKNVK